MASNFPAGAGYVGTNPAGLYQAPTKPLTNMTVFNPLTGRMEANPDTIAATQQFADARGASQPAPTMPPSIQQLVGGGGTSQDTLRQAEATQYEREQARQQLARSQQAAFGAQAAQGPSAAQQMTESWRKQSESAGQGGSSSASATALPMSEWERSQQQAQQQRNLADELRLREQYNAQADARRMADMQTFMRSMPSAPQVSRTSGANAAQEQAARDASFARAKDQAGQLARSSLTSLRESLAGRGMLGGGMESQGTADIYGRGQGQLGEVGRQQNIEDLAQAQHVADVGYQGDIAQRAQDLQRQQSLLSLFNSRGSIY